MSVVCDVCSEAITGRYFKHPKVGNVCLVCRSEAPKCEKCGVPTRSPVEAAGIKWCTDCLQVAERCDGCEAPLGRRFFDNPRFPDKKFCTDCIENTDKCDFCGKPTPDGKTYEDGRVSCHECLATAVLKTEQVSELERQARSWLLERLRLQLRGSDECPIHLVDADQIAEVQHKAFEATPGFDGRERGLFSARTKTWRRGVEFVREEHELNIFIESGLPQAEAFGTTVHELVHLFQFDAFPRNKPVHRSYVEGLACWAQWHALMEYGHTGAAELVANNPDPIYGGGFRNIRHYEKERGFDDTVRVTVSATGGRWTPK